jgi:hypothetical protein
MNNLHYLPNSRSIKRLNMTIADSHKLNTQIDHHSNHLWTLIKLLPDVDWNWSQIMINSNTTHELFMQHIDRVNWSKVHKWPNLTLDIIDANKHRSFKQEYTHCECFTIEYALANLDKVIDISYNPNLKFEHLLNPKLYPILNWTIVSSLGIVTLEHIDTVDLPWNHDGLSMNPNITINYVLMNPNKLWNWPLLTQNIATIDMIEAYPDLPWSWTVLSTKKTITAQYVLANPNKPWNWTMMSSAPFITEQLVLTFKSKQWNMPSLSMNLAISLDFMKQTSHIFDWYWPHVVFRKDITPSIIYANPCLPQDTIRSNLNIDWKIALTNPELDGSYSMSADPNLTWRIVYDHNLKWSYPIISANQFNKTN